MKNAVGLTAVAILAGLTIPTVAEAAIVNGGFEAGFTGFATIGDTRIEDSSFGSGPVEGNSQAFLSTAFNEVNDFDQNGNPIVGGNAAIVPFITGIPDNLEGFLGLSTFFGDPSLSVIATADPFEGSAIRQTFTAVAGQTLSFAYNFLTNEPVGQAANLNFNDFAFASIQFDSLGVDLSLLVDTTANFTDSAVQLFDNETGFRTFSYTIPTTGEYTLGIGVVDVGRETVLSGLLVDRVQVVPETRATLGLLFLGTCGAISVLKRNRSRLVP